MHLDMDKVPSTIKQAVDMVVDGLSVAERGEIQLSTVSMAITSHFGLGMALRNAWSMWQWDTPLKKDAVKNYKIAHADDMSGLILTWSFAQVCGKEFDAEAYCAHCNEHWRKAGFINAVEAARPK